MEDFPDHIVMIIGKHYPLDLISQARWIFRQCEIPAGWGIRICSEVETRRMVLALSDERDSPRAMWLSRPQQPKSPHCQVMIPPFGDCQDSWQRESASFLLLSQIPRPVPLDRMVAEGRSNP